MSLRRRLVLLFFGGTLLLWVPINYFLYRGALAEVDDLWDSHLAQSARILLALATASAERGELEQLQDMLPRLVPAYLAPADDLHRPFRADESHHKHAFVFQLHKRDGSFRLHSASAPDEPLANGVPGFSYRVIDGTAWRVFGIADTKNALILYAGEDHALRKDLAWHLVEHLVFPSLLAIPPLLLLIWLAVAKGLKPLARLVQEVKQRDPNDLHRLSSDLVPVEVEPLVGALNALFVRLERTLESERNFTGNAAHELRTPLAALRVQAQVAQWATSDEQRQRALRQTIAGVDQASRLVDQLLTLARLDSRQTTLASAPVNLNEVARRIAADLEPLARQHRVSVQVSGDTETVTLGDETCLGILVRNLVDNAVRYAGSGGAVTLAVRRNGLFNLVTVRDTGPGIAEGEHSEMFRRFRRGKDTVSSGSGLGLSIVRRIAELHGGGVKLANQARGGLCCEVWLPTFAREAISAARPLSDRTDSVRNAPASTPQTTPSF
jgi:two-component system sensor histidine kinase QseC